MIFVEKIESWHDFLEFLMKTYWVGFYSLLYNNIEDFYQYNLSIGFTDSEYSQGSVT